MNHRSRFLIRAMLIGLVAIITLTGCEWYFAQYWLTITVKEGEGTTDPAPGRNGAYRYDQVISVNAIPASGWELQKITEDHDGIVTEHTSAPIEVQMEASDQEVEVGVYFIQTVPAYTVTVFKFLEGTQTPCEGTVTLNPSGGTYNQGTAVGVTVTPASGMSYTHSDIYGFSSEQTWLPMSSPTRDTFTITTDCNIKVEAFFSSN